MFMLRKSFGPLSSGTKVDLIERIGSSCTVRLVTKPSEELLKQKHNLTESMGKSGIFNIPADMLVEVRNRAGVKTTH